MRTTHFLLVAAAMGLATSANAQSTVVMQKQNTDFALDGNNGSVPGQQVYLWNRIDNVNQRWVEIERGDFYAYQKSNTTLCLDGGSGASYRQPIRLQTCDADNQNQHWDKISLSNGSSRLEKRGTDFSMDGNHGGARGQSVYLWRSANSNVNQQWQFSTVDVGVTNPTPPPATTPETATFRHRVTFEGESVDITFRAFSSRGPLFRVVEQAANGGLVDVDNVPDIYTYIGLVDDHPDAFATAVVRSSGEILATVSFPTSRTWRDINGTVTEVERDNTPLLPTEVLEQRAGSDVYAADVFLDVASAAIVASGGTTQSVLEMIEYSMTSINAIYMRDAAIFNRIGMILLRSTPSQDPYESVSGSTGHLSLFRTSMTTLMGLSTHDLAGVFSNRVSGGIATVGTVGTSQAVSANSPWANGNFTNVARHEFGHNWGVGHFQGGRHIEGPTIMSGNALGKFSSPGIQKILEQRNLRASEHLDNLGNVAPSLPPRAGDDLVTVSGSSTTVIQPLDNDNDVNGDGISVSSVPGQTNAGNGLVRNGNSVTLNVSTIPSDGYDWFRYTIQDSSGLTSDAVVHIRIQ